MFSDTCLEIFWAHLCMGNYAELTAKTISIILIFTKTHTAISILTWVFYYLCQIQNCQKEKDFKPIMICELHYVKSSWGGIYYVKIFRK